MEQILQSAIASFRIEGIKISKEMALETLKKVERSDENPYKTDFVNMVLESEQEIKKRKRLKVSSAEFDNL